MENKDGAGDVKSKSDCKELFHLSAIRVVSVNPKMKEPTSEDVVPWDFAPTTQILYGVHSSPLPTTTFYNGAKSFQLLQTSNTYFLGVWLKWSCNESFEISPQLKKKKLYAH